MRLLALRPMLAALLGLLAACPSTQHANKFTTKQGDAGCSDSTLLGGTHGFGEDCTNDYDCMTVCCVCVDGGSGSWSARICQDGVCSGVETCDVTLQPGFCK